MTIGIYAIVNKTTGDRYVGQSVNIEKRWADHRLDLNSGKAYSRALQEAWDYYGASNFEFQILEQCSSGDMHECEQKHMLLGSSLNHQTPFVEPMAIEHELDLDPNDHDLDMAEPTVEISSLKELRGVLEDIIRTADKLEKLVDTADPYLLLSDLSEDRLIDKLWENASDNSHGVSGAVVEVLRRIDQLQG